MSDLYRDFIDQKADQIINSLGGSITPAPANAELYRDFLDRKFDDVINACTGINTIKHFSYTGVGTNTLALQLPADCNVILNIQGNSTTYGMNLVSWIDKTKTSIGFVGIQQWYGISTTIYSGNLAYDINHNILRIFANAPNKAFNENDIEYTVYYI